jgi:very-short-patch-repair endonuclease
MASLGETLVPHLAVLAANWDRAARRGLEESPLSAAEVTLLGALLDEDLEPECQAEVGPYDADFLFRDQGLCVEVDGAQHRQAVEKDRRRDAYLTEEGIRTLRLRASEVFGDPYACVESIRRELERPRPVSHASVEDEVPTRGAGRTSLPNRLRHVNRSQSSRGRG